jgi:xylulokinase
VARKSEPLLAGLDAGTTSIKAGIYDLHGRSVAQASVPTPTYYPQPGWAFHRAEELWSSATHALRAATEQVDARRIAAVAVASMGEAGVLLDAAGEPLVDVIAWFDRRTQPQVEWLEQAIGSERLLQVTGVPLQPIFGLCKLLWLRERAPEALARAACWLNVGDYLAYRLCGERATDHSLASRTLTLDIHRLAWSDEILDAVAVRPGLLAPLVPSGTRLGRVVDAAARATGVPGTAIVAAGGHDHDCGALALGIVDPGDALNSLGTAEAIFVPLERPLAGTAAGRMGYAQGVHVAAGRYYVHGGLYTSGACVEWLRDVVGRDTPIESLIDAAAQVPPGSLGVHFVPHLWLANPPHDDPLARGAFVGLTADTKQSALFRAVLEGLAYESRLSLETLLGIPGVAPLRRLVAIGGSTRNDLFMRIKAGVLGRDVVVADVPEAVGLGAAILGGLGAGLYRDVAEARASVQVPQRSVSPAPAHVQPYEARYRQVYTRIYPALRAVHHAIAGVERDG